jgi:hypothetical protein
MTVSAAISILSAVLAIARFLVEYFEKQKWIDQGSAEATLKGLQEADAAIAKAKQARADVRDTLTRNPDKLRDDDGFQRPD